MRSFHDSNADDFHPRRVGIQSRRAEDPTTTMAIRVLAIGGAGGNCLRQFHRHPLNAVETIAMNCDVHALQQVPATIRFQVGGMLTRGFGTGANLHVGEEMFSRSKEAIRHILSGSDILFIAAGLGGGTGSAGAPFVARIAREEGALVVAVVTTPFAFEGKKRNKLADQSLQELLAVADSVVLIPNDRLLETGKKSTPADELFQRSEAIVYRTVRSIVGLIRSEGFINVDFADLNAILSNGRLALIGYGEASGTQRAKKVAKDVATSTLFDVGVLADADALLLNIAAGEDISMHEVAEVAQLIGSYANPDANIVWGLKLSNQLANRIQVTMIATGLKRQNVTAEIELAINQPTPQRKQVRTSDHGSLVDLTRHLIPRRA